MYIPDSFTPNGDDKNDFFRPVVYADVYSDYSMCIFNGNGQQLFYTTDDQIGWDGRVYGGTNVSQEGQYNYKINITDSCGINHTYIGIITLLR